MEIRGQHFTIKQIFFLSLYYGFAQYLPSSGFLGGKKIRRMCCKHIFKKCGKYVNIERKANFGSGVNIEIGDYSGIGINAVIPGNTVIGKYVMMGPNCYILSQNHKFEDVSVPMMFQGMTPVQQTVIEDDVWIGRDVIMTPGRLVKKGSIIAAGCILCKDFPEYSIIGGNPSRLIKDRKLKQ